MITKNHIFTCFLTFVFILIGTSALADTTVIGTGVPETDVDAVRDAVNRGGTVVLQGAFHFGNEKEPYTGGDTPWENYGAVLITNSVEIVGKGATIYYGLGNFGISTPLGDPGIKVIIRGSGDSDRLTFRHSNATPILVWDAESVTIKYVDIYDVENAAWEGGELPERYGIWAQIRWWLDPPYDPLLIGKLSITNCTIDLGELDEKVLGVGIGIFGLGTPDNKVRITIKDNVIENCSAYGINLFNIAGSACVVGNTFKPGEIAFEYWGSSGISVGQSPDIEYNFNGSPGIYQPDWAHILIKNNNMDCRWISEEYKYNMCIEIFNLKGVVVKKNTIKNESTDMDSFISIISTKNAFIKKNILSGTCWWGIEAFWNSENISVVGNDLTNVIPLLDEESVPLLFSRDTKNCLAVNNKIGEPGMWGGIIAGGEKALIANNTCYGDNYPGWSEDLNPPDLMPEKKGCVLLGSHSSKNMVVGVKLAEPPPDYNMCDQVLDRGINNWVVGCQK